MVVDVFLTKAVDETELFLQHRVDELHEPQSRSAIGNDETG